jgi:hypothetical protein
MEQPKPKITTGDFFRRIILGFSSGDATDARTMIGDIREAAHVELQKQQDESDRERAGVLDAHGVEK